MTTVDLTPSVRGFTLPPPGMPVLYKGNVRGHPVDVRATRVTLPSGIEDVVPDADRWAVACTLVGAPETTPRPCATRDRASLGWLTRTWLWWADCVPQDMSSLRRMNVQFGGGYHDCTCMPVVSHIDGILRVVDWYPIPEEAERLRKLCGEDDDERKDRRRGGHEPSERYVPSVEANPERGWGPPPEPTLETAEGRPETPAEPETPTADPFGDAIPPPQW